MPYGIDPRVDAYIAALPDWQQAVCREVRDLVQIIANNRAGGWRKLKQQAGP